MLEANRHFAQNSMHHESSAGFIACHEAPGLLSPKASCHFLSPSAAGFIMVATHKVAGGGVQRIR